MPLHYRSVFDVRKDDASAIAKLRFRAWMEPKGDGELDLSAGRRSLGDGMQLTVAEGTGTLRLRIAGSGWPLRWTTTLTVHGSWFWLEQEYEVGSTDAEPPKLRPPGLVREILRVTPGHDGMAMLTDEPQLVTEAGLDVLIDVLCDTERQVPVVVVSQHPRHAQAAWAETAREVTSNLAGLAAVYLLDGGATDRFDHVPAFEDHKVYGGGVRTYLPGVDPASAGDATRHRVLPSSVILDSPGRAKWLLTSLPWRQAQSRPLPEPLQRIDTAGFGGVDQGAIRALLRERPATPVASSRESELEERITHLESALSQVAQRSDELKEATERRRQAEERAGAADERAENEILDHDATRTELDQSLDQVRWLQSELVNAGLIERAYAPVPEDQRTPQLLSIAELRHHTRRLQRVSLDVDWMVAARLDDSFKAATWAAKAWRALRALDDYAEARANGEFHRDFRAYCVEPPPGRMGISGNVVAVNESDDTRANRRFAAARLFRVPAEVHPDGAVYMWAHIKLDSTGRTAPRIHFYDDTSGPTNRIHVGYIGPHLPNKQT